MEGNPSFLYDVCVIDLIKSLSVDVLKNFIAIEKSNSYFCLGHFDIMLAKRFSGLQFPLEVIQNSTHSRDDASWEKLITKNCRHPLYALKQTTSEDCTTRKELDQFWNMNCNFLLVSRFHCDRVGHDSHSMSFSQELLDYSRKETTDSPISHLTIDQETKAYTQYLEHTVVPALPPKETVAAAVVFYDSLELGDIVGFIKSNSISTAMGVLQYLCGSQIVSDAYTYCGVTSELLKFNYSLSQVQELALKNHTLTSTTTRFSVKLAKRADVLLQDLKNQGAHIGFVTGTADVIVNWRTCSEWDFLSCIRKIVHYDDLYEAFTDIITRICVPYIPALDSRKGNLQKEPFYTKFPYTKDLSNVFIDHLERWQYPVSRMVGTLQAMYESSILNALALLLLPGVDAFLARVRYLKQHNRWDTAYEKDISNFLDDWTALSNDISHLESQIVQHPELTPARYYIPAMVLQFERTLLVEYVGIIKKLDEHATATIHPAPSREFAPILLPTSEESVYTLCPLDPEFDTQYTGASPLCIFLPIQRIYRPWELAHMLCHEIQHYSGDALRCREERLTRLANSAAAYIVALLSLQLLQPGYYQPSNLKEEREFQNEIAKIITHQLKSGVGPSYLKYISDVLPNIMFEVAQRPENQDRMQDILFYKMDAAEQMANIHWMCQLNTLANGVVFENVFFKHIHYLCGLYKECYADTAMILTLRCSFQDYFNCIYGEEQQKFTSTSNDIYTNQMVERHTDRLALVILTVEKYIPSWRSIFKPENSWAKIAYEKVRHWQSVCQNPDSSDFTWHRYCANDTILEFALLADEAKELELYLEKCASELEKALELEASNVAAFRTHLKYVNSNSFDWNSALEYLK